MVGTTRSRISHVMNKFSEMGSIDSSDNGELTVHSGLLSVVVHDDYRCPTSSHSVAPRHCSSSLINRNEQF